MDATDQFKFFVLRKANPISLHYKSLPKKKEKKKAQEKQRRDKGWKERVNRKQNKRKPKEKWRKQEKKEKKLSALPNHYHIEKHDSEMSEWNVQATLNTEHFRFPRAAWTNICACSLSLSLSLINDAGLKLWATHTVCKALHLTEKFSFLFIGPQCIVFQSCGCTQLWDCDNTQPICECSLFLKLGFLWPHA